MLCISVSDKLMVFCFDNLLEFSVILFGRRSEEVIWRGAVFWEGDRENYFVVSLLILGEIPSLSNAWVFWFISADKYQFSYFQQHSALYCVVYLTLSVQGLSSSSYEKGNKRKKYIH